MQKAELQHNHVHNQPAQRQGGNAALESPQGEQIAQLEAMAEASPQSGKLAQLEAMANNSQAAAVQRGMMDMIHTSPRMAAQRKAASGIHDSSHTTAQRRQLDSFDGGAAQREAAYAKPNNTGLPDNLKNGIESLSGMSMDNVKVHYNSSQPAQLNALAYAQGTDIHVAPGQEQHLPHEAWHVVQQAQGRVRQTMQMKDGVPVNDDAGLEHEADVMGAKAASVEAVQLESMESAPIDSEGIDSSPYVTAQRRKFGSLFGGAANAVTQRFPSPADDEYAKTFGSFHKSGVDEEGNAIEPDELSAEALEEIKKDVFLLSNDDVDCNCFAWAQGENNYVGMGNLGHWMHMLGAGKFTEPDDGGAKIILWGTKDEDDEKKSDVTHASVKLSHAELLARSGRFTGFKITKKELEESDLPDPCWTSAAGSGFGITAHPKNWYEGGQFGVAIKGIT